MYPDDAHGFEAASFRPPGGRDRQPVERRVRNAAFGVN